MTIPSVTHPTQRTNFYAVQTELGMFWFSYNTCIAFQEENTTLVIRENDWSMATETHLNYINSDKSIRINGLEFEKLLAHI